MPALLAFLLLFSLAAVQAQTPLSNLLYTVGTTSRSGTQDRSYVVLDSFDGIAARGKRFAVYGKAGVPESPGTFTLRGTMAMETNPASIQTLLNHSVELGQNLSVLHDALGFLLSDFPGITNQTLAQRIARANSAASTNAELNEALHLLGTGNPGLQLALGRAFTEVIGSTTTYEVREVIPATGTAGDVAGRVTLTPGAVVVLPAPGRPFQVITNDPADHLLIRLRWGTPAELRRLAVLNSGFDVWRISRTAGEAANFHVTPPTTSQLTNNPAFARANRGSVITTTDYGPGSGPGHADDPLDRVTYFFADNGRTSGTNFSDGQEFYYFVTARDLLGRPGLVSPGGLARACRRIPPGPATEVRVENAVIPGSTNLPRLRVLWRQNTNAADQVDQYWIYRWTNPSMIFTNESRPLSNRVGVVSHIISTNLLNAFLDNSPGAFTSPGLSNIWYTVRAVSLAACDPLLSPHAGPAWGVLREREGPLATTGSVVGSCGTPVVALQRLLTNSVATDPQLIRIRLTVVRRDRGIAWVQFNITNIVNFEERVVGPLYFAPDSDTLSWDYDSPALITSQTRDVSIGCVVGTAYDQISRAAIATVQYPFPANQQRELVFYAGQLLSTALSSSDPFYAVLTRRDPRCIQAASTVPDASGMVALKFDFNDAPTLLVQALTNNTWSDVAVVSPDANRTYWVSYPACLVGPVPPFRACVVDFVDRGDCDEHISAAADLQPTAPLRVRFRLTPRTAEYRVYRRVDDGPMTLFSQGAAVFDPANPGKIIETADEAMPPSAARLCYFVQLLDQHGNGSPLAFIGCKNVKPAKPPRPVLAEPQPAGVVASPQVLLSWFCPTAGISRFQVKVARADDPSPGSGSGLVSASLKLNAAYNTASAFAGLLSGKLNYISFTEAHLTPPIGVGFGPGPQFTLSASVLPNVPYDISVAPVDEQGKVLDSATSEVWRFTWTPPVVLATVPWPARPLPPTQDFDVLEAGEFPDFFPRVAAMAFIDDNIHQDKLRPVGVRVGTLDRSFRLLNETLGTTNFIRYTAANSIVNPDPHLTLFRSSSRDASRANRPLFPIVIYRQQVTNQLFPRVSGDVVQVSPMIERIPWIYNTDSRTVTIPDRLFVVRGETYNDHSYDMLYVRDQQPILAGARYTYFVVRFNAQRELEEIIPAGEVEFPLHPDEGN